MIEGVQEGRRPASLHPTIGATTKHFLGDGGTGGRDQGRHPRVEVRDDAWAAIPPRLSRRGRSWPASPAGTAKDERQQIAAHRRAERTAWALTRLRGGWLEQPWPGWWVAPTRDCQAINAGPRHVHVYSGDGWKQLYDNTLREGEGWRSRWPSWTMRCRHPAGEASRGHAFDRGRPSPALRGQVRQHRISADHRAPSPAAPCANR